MAKKTAIVDLKINGAKEAAGDVEELGSKVDKLRDVAEEFNFVQSEFGDLFKEGTALLNEYGIETGNLAQSFDKAEKAIKAGAAAQKLLNLVMNANPVGLIALAVTGLIVAYDQLTQASKELIESSGSVAEAQQKVGERQERVKGQIKEYTSLVFALLNPLGALRKVLELLGVDFSGLDKFVDETIQSVKDFTADIPILNKVVEGVSATINFLSSAFDKLAGAIAGIGSEITPKQVFEIYKKDYEAQRDIIEKEIKLAEARGENTEKLEKQRLDLINKTIAQFQTAPALMEQFNDEYTKLIDERDLLQAKAIGKAKKNSEQETKGLINNLEKQLSELDKAIKEADSKEKVIELTIKKKKVADYKKELEEEVQKYIEAYPEAIKRSEKEFEKIEVPQPNFLPENKQLNEDVRSFAERFEDAFILFFNDIDSLEGLSTKIFSKLFNLDDEDAKLLYDAASNLVNNLIELSTIQTEQQLALIDEQLTQANELLDESKDKLDEQLKNQDELEKQLFNARGKRREELLAQLEEEKKKEAALFNAKIQQEGQVTALEKQRQEVEEQAARRDKQIASVSAVINTALGVTKALSSVPFPFNLIAAAITAASGAVQVATINSKGFADGGYTGDGGRLEPAGIVHKGEYVTPSNVLANPKAKPHISALESLRTKGYADGGFVGINAPELNTGNSETTELLKEMKAQRETPIQVAVTDINQGQKRIAKIRETATI